MNYYLIIADKQKELTKVIKDSVGICFKKGYSGNHSITYYLHEGSFYAEIKDRLKNEVVFDTDFIEINPIAIYMLNLEEVCKELDERIKKVKEFISLVKKLK